MHNVKDRKRCTRELKQHKRCVSVCHRMPRTIYEYWTPIALWKCDFVETKKKKSWRAARMESKCVRVWKNMHTFQWVHGNMDSFIIKSGYNLCDNCLQMPSEFIACIDKKKRPIGESMGEYFSLSSHLSRLNGELQHMPVAIFYDFQN